MAGSALLVPGTNSGGLKYFRGSWLWPDRGSVTWRPPVQTGPRELRCPYGRGGPVTLFLSVVAVVLAHSDYCDAELNPGKNDPVEEAEHTECQPAAIDFADQMPKVRDVESDKQH